MSAKYIFVTGGVVSSLGKGLAAASIVVIPTELASPLNPFAALPTSSSRSSFSANIVPKFCRTMVSRSGELSSNASLDPLTSAAIFFGSTSNSSKPT